MPFMPFNILGMWLRGLLAVAVIAAGLLLLRAWAEDARYVRVISDTGVPTAPAPETDRDREVDAGETRAEAPTARHVVIEQRRLVDFRPGWDRPTAELLGALALLTWAFGGLWIGRGLAAAGLRKGDNSPEGVRRGDDDPNGDRSGDVLTLRRPDGATLRVECYGPPDAPPIVLTHGWGVNSTEWSYVKSRLAGRFRVVVWDLPGLGLSTQPDNKDFRLETLAGHLDAVARAACGDRPALLVGHSIGGMITLTYARLFPEALGSRVAGLFLAHTTYMNPVRTTRHAALYTALERPVIVPLLHLTIWLWPLVWVLNWLSYLNGSVHRGTRRQSFAGTETRGQLDFAARFGPLARPDVLARGMLAMLAYDARAALPTLPVPVTVVEGDRDPVTLPEANRAIAHDVPRGELVSLSRARHLGLIERHPEFDRALGAFASTTLGAGVLG